MHRRWLWGEVLSVIVWVCRNVFISDISGFCGCDVLLYRLLDILWLLILEFLDILEVVF
jgi:hypothetical protein